VPAVFDRGDGSEIDLAVEEARVQVRRHAAHLFDVGLETEEEGRHVDVGDAA
jgi:hypothetical protein